MSRSLEIIETFPGSLLADLPGKVHGIKAAGPTWTVQCDDCLTCWSGEWLMGVAKRAQFNQRDGSGARLCTTCWAARGWVDEYEGFVKR